MATKEQPKGPPDPDAVHQIKVHGGLGDIIWAIAKKFQAADKPIYLWISNENKARPRRSGILADHLPNVAGWRFDDTTFCNNGQDWGPPTDPACAIGRTWAQIHPPAGKILRLECNKHLESGRRIEDWLPDLPTTHHFDFTPPAQPPKVRLETPYVVLHLAGWPDVPDAVWLRAADLFEGYAHVYIVGGTYDHRPARLAELLRRRPHVTLLQDLAWADILQLLTGAAYCFGHASGFTAIADVLRVPGVVNNPRQHPRLLGTWNSNENPRQIHCTPVDFEGYVLEARKAFVAGGAGVWPPHCPPAKRVVSTLPTLAGAIRAAASTFRPATVLVASAQDAPADIAAAVVHGVLDSNWRLSKVCLTGGTVDQVAAFYTASGRTTRPPELAITVDPEPVEFVVVWAGDAPGPAAARVREGWRQTATRGVLLAVGAAARTAIDALASGLRVTPAKVQGCGDAYYLVRRS